MVYTDTWMHHPGSPPQCHWSTNTKHAGYLQSLYLAKDLCVCMSRVIGKSKSMSKILINSLRRVILYSIISKWKCRRKVPIGQGWKLVRIHLFAHRTSCYSSISPSWNSHVLLYMPKFHLASSGRKRNDANPLASEQWGREKGKFRMSESGFIRSS